MSSSLLRPDYRLPGVCDVTPAWLTERGLRGVILDADNCLVPRQKYLLNEPTSAWFEAVLGAGVQVCILSNSGHVRQVQAMVEPFGVKAISLARKPLGSGFRRALALLGTTPAETVMVGDQILTDILGGNAAGLTTVYVPPLTNRDFVLYGPFRRLERRWLRNWGLGDGSDA